MVLRRRPRNATIKARTIVAVPIANQKSRGRPGPGAAFHDLLRCPVRCWMPHHFSMEDFSVGVPDHEEDVKRTAPHAWTESPCGETMSRSQRGCRKTVAKPVLGGLHHIYHISSCVQGRRRRPAAQSH
jgi:hypothetical protein